MGVLFADAVVLTERAIRGAVLLLLGAGPVALDPSVDVGGSIKTAKSEARWRRALRLVCLSRSLVSGFADATFGSVFP